MKKLILIIALLAVVLVPGRDVRIRKCKRGECPVYHVVYVVRK